MRVVILLCLFFLSAFALTKEQSIHLLNRTSFGYTQNDINFFMKLSKKESVEYLLNQAKKQDTFPLPSELKKLSSSNQGLSKEQRKAKRKQKNKKLQELQNWWLSQMLQPKYAFREKMTLFWHNHFVSEYKVVKNPYMMYLQNDLFRKNSLGNFDKLLHKSSKDLAMLIYLDSNLNKKASPNENYARELLELFTLGEGNYSEEDIKEAARAFTGYRVVKKDFKFKKIRKHHDNEIKNFMGYSGNFDGEDIINIVLKQNQTSKFIVSKLYKEFVSYEVNEELVEEIARDFKASNYDLSLAMKQLLLSKDFWNSKNRMIKSPSEFIVSLLKEQNIKIKNKKQLKKLNIASRKLGQTLFNPPGVQGWEGGTAWIDVSSLLQRQNLVKKILKRKKASNIEKYQSLEFQLK